MQTLILHVGMGKAGSTAIQAALASGATRMHNAGIFCCDHWLLAATMGPHGFATPDEFVGLLNGDAVEFAARVGRIFAPDNPTFAAMHTIIWSNEALAGKWNPVGRFAACFTTAGRHAKIVLYLRHELDWLVAAYMRWCIKDKMTPGKVIGFDRFMRESATGLDYPTVIPNWIACAAPATVIPRAYEPDADTVADFCAVAGIEPPLDTADVRPNATPGYTAHALMKILNDQYAAAHIADELSDMLAEAALLGSELHTVDPCLIDLPNKEMDRIAAEYDARNAPLRTEHGIDLRRGARPGLNGRRHMTHPVNTDLIAALLEIILKLRRQMRGPMQARIDSLEARLAELDHRFTAR